jgi:hypothetical protein
MDTKIRLITKEKFYSIVSRENKKFRKIVCPENFINDINDEWRVDLNLNYQRYFIIDNYPFVWLKDYNLILVPEEFSIDIENTIISCGKFTLQNWKIAKISNQVPYIRNEYTRTDSIEGYRDWYYDEGEYLITDTLSGEEYKVCVFVRKDGEDYYCTSSYICYEEKLNYPPSSLEEKMRDEFYKLIFRNNGEEFKKSYSRG